MTLELRISEPRTSACNEMRADNAVHILCTQICNSQPKTVYITLTKQVRLLSNKPIHGAVLNILASKLIEFYRNHNNSSACSQKLATPRYPTPGHILTHCLGRYLRFTLRPGLCRMIRWSEGDQTIAAQPFMLFWHLRHTLVYMRAT